MMESIPDLIARFDRSNMLDLINGFPEQVKEAIELGEKAKWPEPTRPVNAVLVAGMGGSAIGGNLLQKLISASATVPCMVIRDYRLPGWANPNVLVVVSSYSGNTEETVSAYESARSLGCPCVVCTSGGKILEMAKEENDPVIVIPGGQPPRTALGYLFFPVLVNLIRWGLVKSSLVDVDELLDLLSRMKAENDPLTVATSPAFEVASDLANRLPVVYSSSEMQAIAMRWKGQICENGKMLAYQNVFPEMNHNEIVGWQRVAQMGLNQQIFAIFLKDRDDHPRIQKRMEIVRELILQSKTGLRELTSSGEALLTRMFSLIYLADYVSFLLAMITHEDPTPIPNIDYLKTALADFNQS